MSFPRFRGFVLLIPLFFLFLPGSSVLAGKEAVPLPPGMKEATEFLPREEDGTAVGPDGSPVLAFFCEPADLEPIEKQQAPALNRYFILTTGPLVSTDASGSGAVYANLRSRIEVTHEPAEKIREIRTALETSGDQPGFLAVFKEKVGKKPALDLGIIGKKKTFIISTTVSWEMGTEEKGPEKVPVSKTTAVLRFRGQIYFFQGVGKIKTWRDVVVIEEGVAAWVQSFIPPDIQDLQTD